MDCSKVIKAAKDFIRYGREPENHNTYTWKVWNDKYLKLIDALDKFENGEVSIVQEEIPVSRQDILKKEIALLVERKRAGEDVLNELKIKNIELKEIANG